MRISLVLVAALLVAPAAQGAERQWSVLPREEGCSSLDQVYDLFPYPKGGGSPRELFRLPSDAFPDAAIVPLVDSLAARHERDHSAPNAEERAAYKTGDRANAFVLSSQGGGIEISLPAEAVCPQMRGFAARQH